MFQESNDRMFSYSPISADQLLRRNVINYFEQEQPPFEIAEQANSISNPVTDIEKVPVKRRSEEIYCSYVKKPRKSSPQSKVIRLQIFEVEEMKNTVCNCKASICAQHVIENSFSDEIYKCAKDLLSKIHKKIL